MAAHTPGPWHVARADEAAEYGLIICDSEGGSIGDFMPPGPWMSIEEASANCLVAAAAPDLLVAAQLGLVAMEHQLTLILEGHCLLNADLTPRRHTLELEVRAEVEALEKGIAQVRAAIANATGGR